MQLDIDGIEVWDKRYSSKSKEDLNKVFHHDSKIYNTKYILTGFMNLIVIVLGFISGAHGGWWTTAFIALGFIYIFVYIELHNKAKYLSYIFAVYYKKLTSTDR